MLVDSWSHQDFIIGNLMRCHLMFALFFSAVASALGLSEAQARVPLEVAIGAFDDTNTFKANGYGVLVKYDERCLVVTLAHVVSTNTDELAMTEVVARSGDLSGSISYIDGDADRDIFVGAVNANSNLAKLCYQADDIASYNDAYIARLRNMLERDFDNLALHATPSHIEMSPATTRAFRDAKERGAIRYKLAECKPARGVECISPNKGYSGSIVSISIGGDRLWLGLHQRKCDNSCRGGVEGWQAVSVMQIYEFLASPNSPFNAELARMKGPAIDTPFPVDNFTVEFKRVEFMWDVAFSKFLKSTVMMQFPQSEDKTCEPRCTIWRLREFYGDELNPTALEGFKSPFEELGSPGGEMVASTMRFKVPFDRQAFLDVIASGKALNSLIEETQVPPKKMSAGERLGFSVNGSPDAWIKFYEQVPAVYMEYTAKVRKLFENYCGVFKPASQREITTAANFFFGDMARYEDPCQIRKPWNQMVNGDPSYVISRLRQGF